MLEEVKEAVQKNEVLAVAQKLDQSFQTFHSNAAVKDTEMSNKLDNVAEMLGNMNDVIQKNNAVAIAGTEEFSSFMKPMVRAAVKSAMETYFQTTASFSHRQQELANSHKSMSIEELEKFRGKQKSVHQVRSRYVERRQTHYHLWFRKLLVETVRCDLSYNKSKYGRNSTISESYWHASILIMPAPWVLRKGSLVAFEYITRENRKTSFQINIEPIRIIADDAPVCRACMMDDFKAVRQLIEGSQASRHDRLKNGDTLLDLTLRETFYEIQKRAFCKTKSRRITGVENLVDFFISIGIDPWERSILLRT